MLICCCYSALEVQMLILGFAGRLQYVPTLLRELLLSESEGMVERTLYVEPADTQQRGRINTSDGPIRIRVQCRCDAEAGGGACATPPASLFQCMCDRHVARFKPGIIT